MKGNITIKLKAQIFYKLELETILESNEKHWYVDKISSARASISYQNDD